MRATEMDKAAAKSFAAEEGYEAVADHGLSEHQAVTLYLAGLLAERERCLAVVESWHTGYEESDKMLECIAAKIRSGP